MVAIIDIESGSIAEELGIRPGARLISIDGHEINDELDYRFHNNGEEVQVLIEDDGEQVIYEIEKEAHEDVGLVVEEMRMRRCGNNCIFCFVHQNPPGLRKPLYVKDEDYRFSFLDGHYVTLTNARRRDLQRIVEQRLSPLYVSVHATDSRVRQNLLGIGRDDHLLQKLQFLTSHGIELHAQIVLCPGINDGDALEHSIADLKALHPELGSVAIVPVGLTRFRDGLPHIAPLTHDYRLQTMALIDDMRRQLRAELGTPFVYLADEFYVSTDSALPEADYYENFYQLDNGIGLARDFVDRFAAELPQLKIAAPLDLTLVSGVLGAAVLRTYIVPGLAAIPALRVRVCEVVNRFFGESVTVAGLLVGSDIYNALRDQSLGDYVLLPPRVLNHDRLFIDDWSIDQLEDRLGAKVIIFPDSFRTLLKNIQLLTSGVSPQRARELRHVPQMQSIDSSGSGISS